MSYFLSPLALTRGQTLTLEGEEASHLLKSRRLRSGDNFALQEPAGNRYAAEVVEVNRHSAVVRTIENLPIPPLPSTRLCLIMAAVKDKALEYLLQKTTELGVSGILVFMAEHSPVSDADLNAPKTLARWERILLEACKQSDRQFPPPLHMAPSLGGALARAGAANLRMVLDPRAHHGMAHHMAAAPNSVSAALVIGPEGGLSPQELAQAEGAGYLPATMGSLVLRADTAAIAASALVLLGEPGR